MTAPITSAAGTTAAAPERRDDDAALRGAARQLAGVFAQQLFKAMRETVPRGEGVVNGGSGEEMFTGMLDERLAGAAPGRPGARADAAAERWTHHLADAVYRRLRGAQAAAATPAAVTPPAAGASHGVPPSERR